MKLLVGCPVYERGWILDRWFDAIYSYTVPYEMELEFVFVYTPSQDDTISIIHKRTKGIPVEVIQHTSGDHSTERNWGQQSRIETMAEMRNMLLAYARTTEADVYASIDSDILIRMPEGIHVGEYDAVGLLAYLGTGQITNGFYAQRNGFMKRIPVYDALQPVDVLCAVKFMGRHLFTDERVKYGYHRKGEDFYWSDMATKHGYKLAIETRNKCKHVMKPENIDRYDPRIGW